MGRRLELRREGKEVGLSHLVFLQLTFSRHWAAVCGDNKGAMSHMAFGMGHDPLGSLNERLPSKPGNLGCLKVGLSTARHPHTPDPGIPWDSPELCLLEFVRTVDLSIYLIQLSDKGRQLRIVQRTSQDWLSYA